MEVNLNEDWGKLAYLGSENEKGEGRGEEEDGEPWEAWDLGAWIKIVAAM